MSLVLLLVSLWSSRSTDGVQGVGFFRLRQDVLRVYGRVLFRLPRRSVQSQEEYGQDRRTVHRHGLARSRRFLDCCVHHLYLPFVLTDFRACFPYGYCSASARTSSSYMPASAPMFVERVPFVRRL